MTPTENPVLFQASRASDISRASDGAISEYTEARALWGAHQYGLQQGQPYGLPIDSAEEARLRSMEDAVHQLLADTAAVGSAGDPLSGGPLAPSLRSMCLAVRFRCDMNLNV